MTLEKQVPETSIFLLQWLLPFYLFQLLFKTPLLMLLLSKSSSLILFCLSSPEKQQFLFLMKTPSISLIFPQLFKEDGVTKFQKHQCCSVKKDQNCPLNPSTSSPWTSKTLHDFKTNLRTWIKWQKTTKASKPAGIDNETLQGFLSSLCLNLYFLQIYKERLWGRHFRKDMLLPSLRH